MGLAVAQDTEKAGAQEEFSTHLPSVSSVAPSVLSSSLHSMHPAAALTRLSNGEGIDNPAQMSSNGIK